MCSTHPRIRVLRRQRRRGWARPGSPIGRLNHPNPPPAGMHVPAPTIPLPPGFAVCGSCMSVVSHRWDLSQFGWPDITRPLGDGFPPSLEYVELHASHTLTTR